MKTKRSIWNTAALAAMILGIGTCVPLLAHHSFMAHYDETKSVTLMGTVTKVQWKNPHVEVNMDVRDDAGATRNWHVELNSPNALMGQGWKIDSVKQGDVITITGYLARDGSSAAIARKVTLDTH